MLSVSSPGRPGSILCSLHCNAIPVNIIITACWWCLGTDISILLTSPGRRDGLASLIQLQKKQSWGIKRGKSCGAAPKRQGGRGGRRSTVLFTPQPREWVFITGRGGQSSAFFHIPTLGFQSSAGGSGGESRCDEFSAL